MIQIDMPMPTNCLVCPACNEYLTCAIPVNGRKWGENNVCEFGQGRPEWCPMKEHEAKLLTFDEVKKHYSIPNELHGDIKKTIDYANDIVPLYLECTYEDEWVVHWRDYHNISMYLDSWEKDYGKTWRCWTAKPTAEQRSAAKWN